MYLDKQGKSKQSQQLERICVVTASYPDFPGSSHGSFVKRSVEMLKQRGYQISVVTPRIYHYSSPIEVNGKEKVYRFGFLSEEKLLVEYKQRIPVVRMMTYMFSGLTTTSRVVKQDRCQLIHAHFIIPTGFLAVLVAKQRRVPVVVTAHGSDINVFALRNQFLFQLARLTMQHAEHIIAVSSTLRARIVHEFGISADKVVVIDCGVDTTLFKPMEQMSIRRMLGLPLEGNIVLFVGGLTDLRQKGLPQLLKAMPAIVACQKDVLFVLVGDGSGRRYLEEEVVRAGLEKRVVFAGQKPHSEIPLWLNAADLLVMPSLREGFGLVALEALACGIPFVGTPVGGISQFVTEGVSGLLVKPGDVDDFVEKVCLLLRDATLREQMRANCRVCALPYDIHNKVNELEDVYARYAA